MVVYVKVSNDNYRLIEYMANSPKELGQMIGISGDAISSAISHSKKKGFECIYERVEIDDT